MRMYRALCGVIEAYAERLRTDTIAQEFENADWALMSGDDDDD
ncbi:hypothetical protein [Pseudarthrobacter sp. NIBRBAC000502772]|nr:hypothetical protein [Pseudarthrobacter sp. NIBRBAC000502772]